MHQSTLICGNDFDNGVKGVSMHAPRYVFFTHSLLPWGSTFALFMKMILVGSPPLL